MRLLDSNIFIYAYRLQTTQLLSLLSDTASHVSEMTRLEVLGYHKFLPAEQLFLEQAFAKITILDIDKAIVDKAIGLRQQRKMSPGDAIHAATALLNNLELYTRNVADFSWINGLKVVNPIP